MWSPVYAITRKGSVFARAPTKVQEASSEFPSIFKLSALQRSMSNDPKLLKDLQDASETQHAFVVRSWQSCLVCILDFAMFRSLALSRSNSSRSPSSSMTARSAQHVTRLKTMCSGGIPPLGRSTLDVRAWCFVGRPTRVVDALLSPALVQCRQ